MDEIFKKMKIHGQYYSSACNMPCVRCNKTQLKEFHSYDKYAVCLECMKQIWNPPMLEKPLATMMQKMYKPIEDAEDIFADISAIFGN